MIRKISIFALAVGLWVGIVPVSAVADEMGMNQYEPPESSLSAVPERDGQLEVEGIRGPVETGAMPDRSWDTGSISLSGSDEEPTVEVGGRLYRTTIDLGP